MSTRRTWTKAEDDLLVSLIARFGCKRGKPTDSQWGLVSSHLSRRTSKDCRKRWFHSLDPSLRKGRWSPEEDEIILESYRTLGPAWKQIAALLNGRKDDQVAKRYTDILAPEVVNRLSKWSPEEDRHLTEQVREQGHRWAAIAAELPGRPPLTCRNRWRTLRRQKRGTAEGSPIESHASDFNPSPAHHLMSPASQIFNSDYVLPGMWIPEDSHAIGLNTPHEAHGSNQPEEMRHVNEPQSVFPHAEAIENLSANFWDLTTQTKMSDPVFAITNAQNDNIISEMAQGSQNLWDAFPQEYQLTDVELGLRPPDVSWEFANLNDRGDCGLVYQSADASSWTAGNPSSYTSSSLADEFGGLTTIEAARKTSVVQSNKNSYGSLERETEASILRSCYSSIGVCQINHHIHHHHHHYHRQYSL